jgi:hypothetical protein
MANPAPVSESSYAEMYRRFSEKSRDHLRFTLHPQRGYLKCAEESLCVFTVCVETAHDSQNNPRQRVEEFTFVVHRSALLEIVAEYDEKLLRTNHPHSPPHPGPKYHSLPMDVPLTSRVQMDSDTGHIQREEDSGDTFWDMPAVLNPISWENWGPHITRWFNNSNLAPGDLTRGWGERCVRLAPRAPFRYGHHEGGIPYVVIHFFRSSRAMARFPRAPMIIPSLEPWILTSVNQTATNPEYRGAIKSRIEMIDFTLPGCAAKLEAPTYLLNHVFLHPVISALPYYFRASKERVIWDRVLIDDQMIIGIRVSSIGLSTLNQD